MYRFCNKYVRSKGTLMLNMIWSKTNCRNHFWCKCWMCAYTHTNTYSHTHTHARARTRVRTHTHTHTQTLNSHLNVFLKFLIYCWKQQNVILLWGISRPLSKCSFANSIGGPDKMLLYKMSHRQNVSRTKLCVLKGEEFLTSNYAVNHHIVRNTNWKPGIGISYRIM